ncbi:BTB/POZ domain-containing protein 9 [Myotis brandtii]|uniref:BTB/POZ domain-containing protein 9 n=1 Tax=Myotis brandtii TaxID=109478 RepID=S7PV87_MYOBR|nr:BTB/POZ domain-containing protein 9 [Myotis brandtii]
MSAMFRTLLPAADACHVLRTTLGFPRENVATIADCASVIEGVSRSRNALLNGDTKNYDWDSGYTCHQLGSGAIVVQLAQPYMIGSIRLLLWDCDDRSYSYYIEVSTNQQQWTMVADRTKVSCNILPCAFPEKHLDSLCHLQGLLWGQLVCSLVFSMMALTSEKQCVPLADYCHFVLGKVFHCVHFECPEQQSSLKEETSEGRQN